ncbi:ABC transporter substrate-binding protein [Desulfovibrio sp. JC022]|uniref:substrate-binding periplasmic protein n=1 Tax=Desulfovibrio sp. JC022 TaxID=2593642 RepID=UPI0013D4C74B|nr:transporter substrate-binding domain-containing protein [Desulfovibrio sp. JC022]NDV21352.1 transporter substrate-binding domain-containing protein [Desulfovibrio sp. JC022]
MNTKINYILTICITLFSLNSANLCHAGEKLILSGIESPRSKITFQILREAYSSLGIEVEFKPYPILRSTHSAHSGAVDGELFKVSGVDKKFPSLIKVPVPIDHLDLMVMVRQGSQVEPTWKNLRDLRVGHFRGIFFIENKIATEGIQNAKELETNEQLIKMLSRKRLDAVLIARIAAMMTLKKIQADDVTILSQPLEITPMYHYLNIKHAALVPSITKALEQMSKNDRIKEIRNKILKQELGNHD